MNSSSIVDRAAQCLRDDPTFGLMSAAEQFAEAEGVLARIPGAELDLAAEVLIRVTEIAPTPPPPPPPPRAHIPQGRPAAETPAERTVREAVETGLIAPPAPVFTPPPDNGKRTTFKAKAPKPVAGVVLLKAYKEASGATDSQIAYLVQLPRSTVQAICGGRVPETLDARQRHALKTAIAQQQEQLSQAAAII